MCGFRWATGVFDKTGACQQMSVLGALISLLPQPSTTGLLTNNTGGTSKGDPNAGSDLSSHFDQLPDITTADRAGAGIVTVILLSLGILTFGWMSFF